MESQVTAFHAFLQYEEDKATRAISESREAVTFEASTDSEQPHHGQAGLVQEKSHVGYVANNIDHHDAVASPVVEHISDLESWDPPLLPSLRRHVKWLPINTPSCFYEDLQAMNEFKIEQQTRRRSAICLGLAAGYIFAVLLAALKAPLLFSSGPRGALFDLVQAARRPAVKSTALPLLSPTMPTIHSSAIVMHPINSTSNSVFPQAHPKTSYSSITYLSVELCFLPWGHQRPTSMAVSTFVKSRELVIIIPSSDKQARMTITSSVVSSSHPVNITLYLGTQSHGHSIATTLSTIGSPKHVVTIPAHERIAPSTIDKYSTAPANTSIVANSYSSHAMPCAPTAEWYPFMADASIELLSLPRWAYQHPASMNLSTIISPKAIVVFQHQATRIVLNDTVSDSAELMSHLVALDPTQVIKIKHISKPFQPRQPLLKMDLAAIIGHPTAPANATLTTDSRSSSTLPCTQTADRFSSMGYASVELLLPPWSFRHPASMALSTIVSPKAIVMVARHQATARIALNAAVAESAELMSRSAAPDPAQAIEITPTSELSRPRQLLLMMDRAAIIGHPTAPSNTCLTTDSNLNSILPCSQTTEQYSSMAYASVELLLPPWSFRHPASMALSTIVSQRAIVILQHQPTMIAPNVSDSAQLRSQSTSSGALHIVMGGKHCLIRFASVSTIEHGVLLLPQHQHPASPPPPDPPPGLSQHGQFWGCHCGGALAVAYLLESLLPPPEPPPAHMFLGWVFALCCLMSDVPSLLS